jgi:hypothetical protein
MQQDFIQQQGGGQSQQQVSGQPPIDFLAPADQALAAQNAVGSGPPPEAPPAVPQGAGLGAVQGNPFEEPDEPVGEEEQAEYEDLFIRVMAAVNDVREAPKGGPSPADAVIKMMSVKGKEAHVAVGTTAGLIMTQMTDMAKRAGKEYSGRVIQEVGMDLVVELLDIANVSGAIKNLPEEDSPEFEKLVELSVLEASKLYGEWQLRTGQADRQGHMQEVQEGMQREADAGELDDWGMEELDPQMRARVAQQTAPKGGA